MILELEKLEKVPAQHRDLRLERSPGLSAFGTSELQGAVMHSAAIWSQASLVNFLERPEFEEAPAQYSASRLEESLA